VMDISKREVYMKETILELDIGINDISKIVTTTILELMIILKNRRMRS
jgi:hypothetical protein